MAVHMCGFLSKSQSSVLAALLALTVAPTASLGGKVWAQAPQNGSLEQRLKTVETERDALRKEVDELQARVTELQRTIDSFRRGIPRLPPNSVQQQIWDRMHAAQSENAAAQPERQPQIGPTAIVHRSIYQRLQPDLVSLAVPFSDAAAATVRAKTELEAAKRERPQGGEQAVRNETSDLRAAEQKLRVLRRMLVTLRDDYATENDRIRQLTQAGAVPTAYLHDRELQVKLLDALLAEDPEAPAKVNPPPKPAM
jgi:septal ring factor EnvC (AmiA/AmiB activator)